MKPESIGRYQIRSQLGQGGMATVYRGYDPRFDREVAIKILPHDFLEDPTFRERFEREAKTIASLEHPAIVPVHDFGEEDGQPFLVMRLMTGGSLADKLEEGILSPEAVAGIVRRIGSALDEAHKQGVVHRDLKPGNILFDQYGEAFLADFGIVRLVAGSATLTEAGGTLGTPGYMSPEQIQGNEVDGRSDIYALGVITYEMLTGKAPFAADSPAMVIVRQMTEEPPSARALRPDLSEDTDSMLRRSMSKKRSERPATAQELAEMLAVATKMTQQAQEMLAEVAKAINGQQEESKAPITSQKLETKSGLFFDMPRRWLWAAGFFSLLLVIGVAVLLNKPEGATSDAVTEQVAEVTATPVEVETAVPTMTEVAELAVEGTMTPVPTETAVAPTEIPPTAQSTNNRAVQENLDAAWVHFEAGQYEKAIAAANAALKLVEDARAYHIRGLAYRQAGNVENALADLSTATDLDAQNEIYWLDRSLTYAFFTDRANDALQDANRCVEIAPDNAECYGARGQAYLRLGDYESALIAYNQAISLDPTLAHMYGQRQDAQRELGFVEESLADSTKAIELQPDYAQFYGDRAYTYLFFTEGQSEKARADAAQCAALQPDLALCYYTLGVAQRNLQNTSAAVSAFETFLELVAPDDVIDWQAVAAAFVAENKDAVNQPPDGVDVQSNSDGTDLPGVETVSLADLQPQIPWLPADASASGSYLYYFQVETPPFDNVLVRQALVTAVNRTTIAELATSLDYPNVMPATSFTHPAMLGRDLYGDVGLSYDAAKAQALLAEAGYENGAGFPTIMLVTNSATVAERHRAIAEAVAQMWREVLNINVEVQVLDISFGDYVNLIATDPPGLYRFGYAPDEESGNDPYGHLEMWLGSGGAINYSGFASEAFDALLEEALANAENPAVRQQIYIAADQLVTEEETAVLPLFHYTQDR